ncbi:Ribosomal RNA large subunit methyltransferase K/L [invertebrate metagenome]|uniref:Ribosomal RNA large subunit methyltransferase K/L n=1 Tax=invertebrate metagenome TaxID=1711999 RepID=A0A2H9T4Y0_9ZZZZ
MHKYFLSNSIPVVQPPYDFFIHINSTPGNKQMNTTLVELFASCPRGMENLLASELQTLGAQHVRETVAGVSCQGSLSIAYRSCLWSRLASRILLRLGDADGTSRESLYDGVQTVDWSDHLEENSTFRVDFSGATQGIQHTHFGALVVKDAIVDQLRDRYGWRPSVQAKHPDIRINVHIQRGIAHISLDFSGESLHQRGYRLETGDAPMKENLAAAILLRAGWPDIAKNGGTLLDPMCGSGTILIEGAMMAADIAPGLLRTRFGFDKWPGHIQKLWLDELEQARERRKTGLSGKLPRISGYDGSAGVIGFAKANMVRAGVKPLISIKRQDFSDLHTQGFATGLLLTNPPYGERMGDDASLVYFYRKIGQTLKAQCPGWQVGIFSGAPELCRSIGMSPKKQYALFNGALPCRLFLYDVMTTDNTSFQEATPSASEVTQRIKGSDGAVMFANRLIKNQRLLKKWTRKQLVSCYRLYDADMPEYAMAIDLYNDWAHVQEYVPPKKVDPEKARQRLLEALEVIPTALDIPEKHVVLKQRQRQSGKNQYQPLTSSSSMMEITEGKCRLLVNLRDYLDTGLFLDHRIMRLRIAEEAQGKDFLNLFCYTGTASIHAAMNGASSTTSVDMSNTYLQWAKNNLALNGISPQKHSFEQADCLQWLAKEEKQYDLIFMDPPTFSNSKRMRGILDIQRDHIRLIQLAMARLRKSGTLYFSTNFRRFKIDDAIKRTYLVHDISQATIDKDFQRHSTIHYCWQIQHP